MRFQPSTFLGTLGELNITQTGLVFDFQAADYVSGSTTWNAAVGDYTASVTGTVGGGLNYIDGTKVGFGGSQWLEFPSAMTASISSSTWQVYALVNLASTSSNTTWAPMFSKGPSLPGWYYAYRGGTVGGEVAAQAGAVIVNGSDGLRIDSYNTELRGSFPNVPQLFAFTWAVLSAQNQNTVTVNWRDTHFGNSIAGIDAPLSGSQPISFSGSAGTQLLFGYNHDGNNNFNGSVVRLFAYNRILTEQERKNNWFALTGQYIP